MQHLDLDPWNPYPLPPLPAPLGRLTELAYNLYWSWHPDAGDLYKAIDSTSWDQCDHNPVRFLRRVAPARLAVAAADGSYVAQLERTLARFDAYLNPPADHQTCFAGAYPDLAGHTGLIAYFSAEFGLHESLPVYSGGLGILAGDHCKAASDLGVPLVGVGLLYAQSYFTQTISGDGVQEARYEKLNMADAPIRPAVRNGLPVMVEVQIGAQPIHAMVWYVLVGRVVLILLDTDVPGNGPEDREVGAKLYGGGPGNRLRQEMILGLGGVRALRQLGLVPLAWHLNEGHAAFAPLEVIREMVAGGTPFETARARVAAATAFTTHTPVKAGHDEFSEAFVLAHFDGFAPQLGLSEDAFLGLARRTHDGANQFSMTALAFHLASRYNAVSRRHGEVSRAMWQDMWPGRPVDEVPIAAITNGVHQATWQAPEVAAMIGQAESGGAAGYISPLDGQASLLSAQAAMAGNQAVDGASPPSLPAVLDAIPDADLWALRNGLKYRLVQEVRQREHERRDRLGWFNGLVAAADRLLDPGALTLGFARRFATYKRALLLFHDPGRLAAILSAAEQPVQIVFAGKAHPADSEGQAVLQRVYQLSQAPEFRGRIVVLEDYGMDLARLMVQGVDVWLNTPRRPQEASGTSGQKAAMNGVANFSVLDGWWIEGFHGDNGWAVGELEASGDSDSADASDAAALYETLTHQIVPLYYARDGAGLPHDWLKVVRAAIRGAVPDFTAERMVREYADRVYVPAARTWAE